MRLTRSAGLLTRIALLVPLAAGGRIDCGAVGAERMQMVGSATDAADCHGDSNSSQHSDKPHSPERSGVPAGHCPAYHSCTLDFSCLARVSGRVAMAPLFRTPATHSDPFASISQLPELPPPKA